MSISLIYNFKGRQKKKLVNKIINQILAHWTGKLDWYPKSSVMWIALNIGQTSDEMYPKCYFVYIFAWLHDVAVYTQYMYMAGKCNIHLCSPVSTLVLKEFIFTDNGSASNTTKDKSVMKRKFNQWWSTIPPISTKQKKA